MSILLEHIEKRYAGQAVVDGVSLSIPEGELFVLLGPSGSGKSTLLRAIAGLTELEQGRVVLHGRDVTAVPPRERGIGFVFQSYGLFGHMTVADNVEFALRVRRVPRATRRARREELLELVGLTGFAARFPAELSGGQQQRVALARALAHRPDVLLLDEPFGALDAKIRLELRDALRSIQRELGLTTVFVTHDQEEAFALADRLAVLRQGRLIEVGSPQELYLRPRSPFVATFLGAGNLLVGETSPDGVRLGEVELPLATKRAGADGQSEARAARRAQVLVRPEDVLLGPLADPSHPYLGRAVVERRVMVAGQERLRLALPQLTGVRSIAPTPTFGNGELELDAHRPLHECLALPLAAGDEVEVRLRRFHIIAPAGLRLLVDIGPLPASLAASELGRAVAARVGAHLTEVDHELSRTALTETTRGSDDLGYETERLGEGFDLAVLGLDPEVARDSIDWMRLARHHVLLVTRPSPLPRRILVCVTPREHGQEVVRFAERLAWLLGGEGTVMTVVPRHDLTESGEAPAHVQRFLRAAGAALGARGVTARTKVRVGRPLDEVRAELATGEHDLVVIGAPPRASRGGAAREATSGIVPSFMRAPPPVPFLVVRR